MKNAGQAEFFRVDELGYTVGMTERRLIETVEKLRAARDFSPAEETVAEVARALAANIDKGNMKGRAIANEAAQMLACLEVLSPAPVDEPDDARLDPITEDLLRALTSTPAPRPHATTPSDAA